MSNISSRIKEIINNEDISIRAFEQKIGCSNGVIARCIAKNTDISSNWVSKIFEEFPRYNPVWLLSGEGNMLKGDAYTKVLPKEESIFEPGGKYQAGDLPLVEVEAVAGFGNNNFAIETKDVISKYSVPEFHSASFLIRVRGDSMSPAYNSGDMVACLILRESQFIQWNEVHVIATREQGILIKRLRPGKDEKTLLAISENTAYQPFEIPRDEITGIALVLGGIRLE